MNNSNFKAFKECILNAGAKDPVWWAGYLWLDLTKKQSMETVKILVDIRKFPRRWNERAKTTEVVIPSGIGLFLDQHKHYDDERRCVILYDKT